MLILSETEQKNFKWIPKLVNFKNYGIIYLVANITEKPNYVTPKQPFKEQKIDTLNDDIVDRAFK